jgi:dTDP-4-dehydrorhamnose 3,5-epimerase
VEGSEVVPVPDLHDPRDNRPTLISLELILGVAINSPSAFCSDRSQNLQPVDIQMPQCAKGIGVVIHRPEAETLIDGVRIEHAQTWPDDRGYFLEVHRSGRGLASEFASATTQVSATLTYPTVVKAFHHHLHQSDCWTVVKGMIQVALADLRSDSPTFGHRNTIYMGELRPLHLLIPPGVAHGYKVLGTEPAVLVYVTSRFYDPSDEHRIAFDSPQLNYDWETQYK